MQINEVSSRRYIIGLLGALLLLSLFVGYPLVSKKQGVILIQGIVLDSQNKPISNIAVTFSSPDSKIVKRKKISTSDSGRFEFLQVVPATSAGKKTRLNVTVGSSTYTFPASSDKQSWAFFQRIRPDTYKINIGHTLKNRIEVTGNFSIQASATKAIFRDGNRYAVTRTNEGIFSIKELDSSDTVINENVTFKAAPLRKTILGTIDGKPVTFNEQGEVFYDGSQIGDITFFADSLKAQASLILETRDAANNPVGNYEIAIDKKNEVTPILTGIPSNISFSQLEAYSLSRSIQFNEIGEIQGAGINGQVSALSPHTNSPSNTSSRPLPSVPELPTYPMAPPSPLPSPVPGANHPNEEKTNESHSKEQSAPTQTEIAFRTQFAEWKSTREAFVTLLAGWEQTRVATPPATCTALPEVSHVPPNIGPDPTPTSIIQTLFNSREAISSEEDPFPKTCNVGEKIHVYCFSEGASALILPPGSEDPFKMMLSPSLCKGSGLCQKSGPDGTPQGDCLVSHEEFREQTQCQGHVTDSEDSESIENCCSARHEYAHICDADVTTRCEKTYRCAEQVAEKTENYCQQKTLEYYCGGENPRWSDKDNHRCNAVCGNYLFQAMTKVWDACMCAKAVKSDKGVSLEECCSCTEEIKPERVLDLLPESCRKTYPNTDSIDEFIQVNRLRFSSSVHGCSYYNETIPENQTCYSLPTATATASPKPTVSISPTVTATPEVTEGKPIIPEPTNTVGYTEGRPVLPKLPSR